MRKELDLISPLNATLAKTASTLGLPELSA